MTTQIQELLRTMAKQIIRLTESDLHRIVKEAVNRILTEDGEAGGFAPGANTTFGLNADGSADSTFGISYPYGGKKKDPTLTRPKGDIAMNKGEKPVGHKG